MSFLYGDSFPRTDFGQPPPGYVPGLGRGAVGFTTRSDIGPAKPAAGEPVGAPPGFPGMPGAPGMPAPPQPEKEQDYSDATFDEFAGYSENLFAGDAYDEEDREADMIYDAIDRKMDSKRKARREAIEQKQLEEYRKKRPKIAEQFRDLKKGLATVTEDQWMNIPDPRDFSRRNKLMNKAREKQREKFTVLPDNVLLSGLGPGQFSQLDQRQQVYGGMETPLGVSTPLPVGGATDLTQLSKARDKMLSLKLDRVADSVTGTTVVDPKGYLTDLNSVHVSSDAEISDIQKARTLLDSVRSTNPQHGPAWIAAARLERETGKIVTARQLILKGCKICNKNEDVWLEAARLHTNANAKAILAKAVRHIPNSVKLWLAARDLEETPEAKKAVLRQALNLIPNSVKLWKAAVEQEDPEDARILLSRAVDCVPQSVEMWLALARLESADQAKAVLNRARKALPHEPKIWIAAAKLEEANQNFENIDKLIRSAVKILSQKNVMIDRDTWLAEAENAERSGAVLTCQAIVRATIAIGVEPDVQRRTWLNDAQTFLSRSSIETARAVYALLLSSFPAKAEHWKLAAQLEKQHGTAESLDKLLENAVKHCPQSEELWQMAAKEKWNAGDIQAARQVLHAAFAANPESEDIWLAAVKLESENNEYARARALLVRAREKSMTARVWMKSALLERQLGNHNEEEAILKVAVEKFPDHAKLWTMLGQLYYHSAPPNIDSARQAFKQGSKNCPDSVDLWIEAAKFEADVTKEFPKARSILEKARLRIPQHPQLLFEAILVEQKAGNDKVAEQLLAKALQQCPSAGILWALAIAMDPKPAKKSRSYDALKKCTDDAHVFSAVARLFWQTGKVTKARDWFIRAVTVDPDFGDAWAFYYKFEQLHGSEDDVKKVRQKCEEASPRHGRLWVSVSKDYFSAKTLKAVEILDKLAPVITDPFQL